MYNVHPGYWLYSPNYNVTLKNNTVPYAAQCYPCLLVYAIYIYIYLNITLYIFSNRLVVSYSNMFDWNKRSIK